MSTIRQLPESLINKIAAGEVIERPASVVKELLENSIDAGATQIELTIDGGGIDLIRVADNGCGIAADEMHLAIAAHATSKLTTADDLFAVRTLGFRGEALASIAEVSHMVMRSRRAIDSEGTEIVIRGSQRDGPAPSSCAVGTCIEVRNLFYSTPVRKKFLKSPQTEMGHTLEAFMRIALAHPQVMMTLRSGNRTVHELPATPNWAERIFGFFGSEIADNLITIDRQEEEISLRGYVVGPTVSRGNNRMQYLFLNGRYIRDRSLQHALGEAYRGLLMVGRFPICFLHLQLAPDQVDVNVHPTKSEVRFVDGGSVYRGLLQTLRNKFLTTDLNSHVSAAPAFEPAASPRMLSGVAPIGQYREFQQHERSLLSWARGEEESAAPAAHAAFSSTLDLPRAIPGQIPPFQPFSDGTWPVQRFDRPANETAQNIAQPQPIPAEAASVSPEELALQPSSSHLGFQIHNRYLITQDDMGMVVIDQHALHERILYEQLKTRIAAKSLETQRLLIPDAVHLNAAEAALAIEHQQVLAEIGIHVEPFGGDCVLITAYPAMLANINPAEILSHVLEKISAEGAKLKSHDVVDTLLHLIACKAAIKAGDRLSADEITTLLEQRYAYEDTHHCPHGRPTALHFSRSELDKMFKRT